ncbi:CRISPR-associated endonuclease Cas6 [Halanaerobium hydrogeniformans]|uniref:DNA repair protein n=1 Tax=Halanaerobium hydrogeniformans TaxID=656519 RepID=E4RLK3_HALHG|nr:CRISPR-associated endonuclease Cas6 [Halanaerobium hydrogeniformans]ADQ14917.1 hypothetical protein Halsa_1492 [Halanaerobium hydrogeniformans]
MLEIKTTKLNYELEDKLPVRYGHKLRGFFANEFDDILFHQHKKDGSLRYQYPLIQYKIIDNKPLIIGLGDGAEKIINNFLEVEKLRLDNKIYHSPASRLKVDNEELFVNTDYDMPSYKYTFLTPWLGLSQKNYKKYIQNYIDAKTDKKMKFLKRLIIGNILSFAKGINWWIEEKIILEAKLEDISVQFKNEEMVGFKGHFYSNIYLPELIGLGKSTSRGFGTIRRKNLFD